MSMKQQGVSLDDSVIKAVKDLAKAENRSFSYMSNILIQEALEARNKLKNKKGGNS